MNRRLLAFFSIVPFIVACGNEGESDGVPCQNCEEWEKCQVDNCVFDLSSQWDILAVSGTVSPKKPSGDAWDALDGAPDPLVCVTVIGDKNCTLADQDTFKPSWNQKVAQNIGGEALMGGINIAYADEDISSNEGICSGNIAVQESDFADGGFSFSCKSGYVLFELIFVR